MTDLLLRPREQAALTCLMAAEPVPGRPLPERRVLELVGQLIPCDAVGGFLFDASGTTVDSVALPHGFLARFEQPADPSSVRLAVPLGIRHFLRTACAADMHATGIADSLHLGLRNGADHVVDLWFDRTHRPFTERDVAVLGLLGPALARLVSERSAPHLPPALTTQERRVLMLVTSGCSNPEIAERLVISSSTVRKHLEHAYRKLGVGNRQAAVAVLQGRDRPGLDLRERLERYA